MADSDVLVVDDDDATREGLSALLRNAGFTVDTANDGAEAIEKIDAHDFSVVLLDLLLPRIAGLEMRPGGFGLVLIRAIADELIYNERRNELVFVKYLDPTPAQKHA